MKYQLNGTTSIVRTEDGASIPMAEGNRDYADYLEWVAAGNVADPDPMMSLANLKKQKIEELNQARAAANQTTFDHAGKTFAVDALSRSDIDGVANNIGLFGTFPVGFPGGWRAIDGSALPMADIQAFKDFYASMTAKGSSNFAHSQQLKTALAAATTPEAIAAITW
jgi:hypothetical protein